MDLTKKDTLIQRADSHMQFPNEYDHWTAQLCFGTSAGLMLVATLGWLAELVIGIGGHLAGLIVFSLGYLCCGLKQQCSIWLAQRAIEKEQGTGQLSALTVGCLPHAEVLPTQSRNLPPPEAAKRSRTKPLHCI